MESGKEILLRLDKQKYPFVNNAPGSLEGEEWKSIEGLEGIASISNKGRVYREGYTQLYSDGRRRYREATLIRPSLGESYNGHKKETSFYPKSAIKYENKMYRFRLSRLVYNAFVSPIDLTDNNLFIINKNGDTLDLSTRNLVAASHSQKSKRMYDSGRAVSVLLLLTPQERARRLENYYSENAYKVSRYDKEGRLHQTYPSVKEAALQMNISKSRIWRIAAGHELTGGGYIWRYGDEKKIDLETKLKQKRKQFTKLRGTKVSQYNTSGERIAVYPSIADAGRAIGKHGSQITDAINKKAASAYGFLWRKGYGPKQIETTHLLFGQKLKAERRGIPVKQYSLENRFICRFPGIKAAADAMQVSEGTLSKVLRGEINIYRGFIWKFA